MIRCYGPGTAAHGQRQAFTQIELRVVISIINMLAGLLLAAVMRVFISVDEARVSNEIAQLNTAVESFKNSTTMGGFYFPSKMTLAGTEDASDLVARAAIRQMFPRINWQSTANPGGTVMDWDGNGTPDGTNTLNGAQCLVFFLGGPGGKGFSTNVANPTLASGDRIPPFNFHPARLTGSPFPHYTDIYNQPYLYFSSYGKVNGYVAADCTQLAGGAYQVSSGKFANPSSFQIISAGRDANFGGASGGNILGSLSKQGQDNLSNFQKGTLGTY
ncbi:MAG: type II secretion system protein [Gemmataceae bacterium]